jgi:hypothetical protein
MFRFGAQVGRAMPRCVHFIKNGRLHFTFLAHTLAIAISVLAVEQAAMFLTIGCKPGTKAWLKLKTNFVQARASPSRKEH